MLKTLLSDEMKKRNMSARQAATDIGDVSHTTIIRALRGEDIDVPTVIKLGEWLGVRPHTLLNSMADNRVGTADKIAAVLERSPSLEKEFRRAIDLILAGKVGPELIEDIAAYASYRLNIVDGRRSG